MITYLWHLERATNEYRVQTDSKEIADKLKRRQGFRISAIALNYPLWIFSCEFKRPDIARKTIKSITGKNGKIDSEGVLIYE